MGNSHIQHKVDGQVMLADNKPRLTETGRAKSYFLDKLEEQNEGMFLKEGVYSITGRQLSFRI
ncbi:MAG: hypothetical protein ABI760_24090 [Ferruginibacter sp.]